VTETVEHAADTSPSTKKKRILLAEDDSTTRLFLLNHLKKRGLEVDTAPNGNLALKKLKGGGFDAVILDLMLPGVKGRELIKEIRKGKHCTEIPIFVVTSAQRIDLWRKLSTKAGATKVLDKAAPVETIVAEIVDYLIPKAKKTPPAEKTDGSEKEDREPVSYQVSPSPVHATASAQPAISKFAAPMSLAVNTELLRKIARAGQAARGTPAPNVAPTLLSGDTPLHIAEFAEATEDSAEATAGANEPEVEVRDTPAPEVLESNEAVIGHAKSASSNHEVRELEEQLAELRRNRDELARLLRDQPVVSSSSEPNAAIQETLDEAKAATQRAETAYEAEVARSRQFEEELKRILEARDELNRKIAKDEESAAESHRRSKELEERLAQSTSELERAKAELEKNAAERSTLVGELREQISSARQSADTAKVAYEQQAARAQDLAEELENLRNAREELNARLQAEMQAAAESKRRIEEREQQLREREAEVERLKNELNRRAADSDLSRKLSAAQVAAREAQAVYKQEAARGAQFEKELARLTAARDELNAKLAREEQTAADARRRSEEMEQQLAGRSSELERLRSQLDRHVEERKTLERQLQEQVVKAGEAAERVRQEFQQKTSFSQRSSTEKDALRQVRDELNARLEREQQGAADSRRHSHEVESKLQAATRELADLRTKLQQQADERTVRSTPSSSPAKAGLADTTVEPAKQRAGLAQRIIAPLKIFSRRSENSAIQELEARVAEMTRNRDELLVLLRDRSIEGLQMGAGGKPESPNELKAAAKRAEAAHQAQLARSRQFEEELKRIREAREELNRKLVEQENAAQESRRRSNELEERLVGSAAELVLAKAELEKTVAEHSAVEQTLRQQLQSIQQFADSTNLAQQKQAAFAQRSVEQLAELRKADEELNARLQAEMQTAAQSKGRIQERDEQLRQRETEVERLKTELGRRAADQELSRRLGQAENAARIAQTARKEEAARGAKVEEALARLKQAREELNAKLAAQEQAGAEARRRSEEMERLLADRTAELGRLKSELHRHGEQRKGLEQQLKQQVTLVSQSTRQVQREFQEETSFFHRANGEVDALRQARDELNGRFEREQQATIESRRHSEELERKLQAATHELGELRGALEKHSNERATLVTESSRQLQAVRGAETKAEKAYKEQLKRSAKFAKELAALRQNPPAVSGQRKKGQKSTAKSSRKVQELAKKVAAQAAELEKARVEFEQLVSERQRLESAQRIAREPSEIPTPAEARFRESIAALGRVTAQLEKEQSARRRGEDRAAFLSGQLQYLQGKLRNHVEIEQETQQRVAEFEQHVREREGEVAKTIGDFQKETAARQLVQAQLKATGDMGNQFQEQFNLLDEAKRVFDAAQEKLQARLESAVAAHKASENELQRQVAERKRVRDSLEEAQRKLQDEAQQHAEQIGELQSALELETIERRKQESHSLQLHYTSIDASRLGHAFVNGFRAHLRPSAGHILDRTRRLLELPLEDEHRKLVEAALESALTLQTSMQDDTPLPGEADIAQTDKAA